MVIAHVLAKGDLVHVTPSGKAVGMMVQTPKDLAVLEEGQKQPNSTRVVIWIVVGAGK